MTDTWSIVQYGADGAAPTAGILRAGRILALPSGWPTTVRLLLEDWSQWEPRLRDLDVEELPEVGSASLVAPLTYPRKVICAGANYYDHAAEMGTAAPDPADQPFFFLKPPTTSVVGPDSTVRVADLTGAQLDWEVELAVVIGTRCLEVDPSDAWSVIAGYCVANDLSARGRFPRPAAVFPPFAWDWLAHKGFDGSCPLGPGIVPAWQIPDPNALGLRLWVNGSVKQDSSTADMVVGVAGLVAGASRVLTLEPGDVILTGTPAGVGMPRSEFLADGDVVVAEIDGIGRLSTVIEGM